jgi:hypothetical protein
LETSVCEQAAVVKEQAEKIDQTIKALETTLTVAADRIKEYI